MTRQEKLLVILIGLVIFLTGGIVIRTIWPAESKESIQKYRNSFCPLERDLIYFEYRKSAEALNYCIQREQKRHQQI